MKTVLLTGATGFLGYYIARQLSDSNYKTIALVRNSSDISHLAKLSNIEFILFNEENVKSIYKKNKNIKAIIHAATTYGKQQNYCEVQKVNFFLPSFLLHSAIEHKVNYFINCDSFFTDYYQSYKNLEFYTLSKHQFRQWGEKVASNSRVKFVNLKIFHMYGARDREDKFIPSIIRQLSEQKDNVLNLTNGEQIRDFIYVEDVARIIKLLILHEEQVSYGFNNIDVGTGIATSIKNLVMKLACNTNTSTILNFGAIQQRQGEIMYAVASKNEYSFLKDIIFTNLDEGLLKTINHFLNQGFKIR
ncbi:MAG: NAD-dependent epimerase/dehydratase family protein [Sphingobacteriia bacterium]|nr:NAD-dependent epimerase/dehydratase family protein [Sphingobacteriia bacterium]